MLKAFNLKTEHKTNPLGIDVLKPVFSWQIKNDEKSDVDKQTAFQIRVASNKKLLKEGKPDFWNSGKIKSEQTCNIIYQGKELKSAKRYFWQVCIWNKNDQVSEWSQIFWWKMGLLNNDDWQAEWIGGNKKEKSAPYFRKKFETDKEIKKARIYICGLGYYELKINGDKVGKRVLEPAFTDYEERVLYSTYDITKQIQKKSNIIGVELGRGRYSMTTPNVWGWEKPPWREDPKLIAQLIIDYVDDSRDVIVSDSSWKTISGPRKFDSLYTGEIYDAREEEYAWDQFNFDDSEWENATIVDKPAGELQSQLVEAIKIVDKIKVKKINKLDKGHYVFDFGKITAGWVKLKVSGKKGDTVKLKYGEKLHNDGTVNIDQNHIDDEIQTDTYILKGSGNDKYNSNYETWEPSFSYKGFQFVEVIGFPGEPDFDTLEAKVLHTDVDTIGDFECSNKLLEQVHDNTCNAILNNLHSIPTDTPVFEKNGWTGDAQLTAEAAMYNFDMINFYKKCLCDFKDSQRKDGELAPIVPTSDWGYADTSFGWDAMDGVVPAWDSAYILITWWVYKFYGDKRFLEDHYENLKLYLDYLKMNSDNYIVKDGLGDWLEPTGEEESRQGKPPEEAYLTSTAYFYQNAKLLSKIAEVLGFDKDKEKFINLMEKIRNEFNSSFYNKSKHIYESNSEYDYRQTSNVIPLAFGLVPDQYYEQVMKNLLDNIKNKHDYHLDTGILGTKYILNLLTENGYVDIAYAIATQKTYPSWGYWIENGATALYEAWELDARSYDHHMYGSIDDWFYKSLAGIRTVEPGFKTAKIKPYIPEGLHQVKAEIETIRGKIISSWEKYTNSLVLDVTIPTSVTAEVLVPLQTSKIEAHNIEKSKIGVKYLGMEAGYAKFQVKSGNYQFKVSEKSIRVNK